MNAKSKALEYHLPDGCRLRAAEADDRGWLQHFVFSLIRTEALAFDVRILTYRLTRIVLLLSASGGLYWLFLLTPSYWPRFVLVGGLLYTLVMAFVGFCVLLLYLVLIPTEPLVNWFLYSIVDYQGQPIACIAMTNQLGFSVLYHLFVVPPWRQRAIGSYLVQAHTCRTQQPLYLACKPKRRAFYQRLGFQAIAWDDLEPPVRAHFQDFEMDTRLSGTIWHVMQYQFTQTR